MVQYKDRSDQAVIQLIHLFEGAELQGGEMRTYPLNVSRDRSLLLGLGGGGRMLSVTGATILPGEPSSWMVKVNVILFEAYTLLHREVYILVNITCLRVL